MEDWEKFVSHQAALKYDLEKLFYNPSINLDLGGPGQTIKLSLIDPPVGSWEYRCMYPETDTYTVNKNDWTFRPTKEGKTGCCVAGLPQIVLRGYPSTLHWSFQPNTDVNVLCSNWGAQQTILASCHEYTMNECTIVTNNSDGCCLIKVRRRRDGRLGGAD